MTMVCLFCRKKIEPGEWKLVQDISDAELEDENTDLVVFHERLGPMCLKHHGVREMIKKMSIIIIKD